MQNINIFDFIDFMSSLIRSEERKKCAEQGLQLVHYDVLLYLSQSNQQTNTPAILAAYFGITRGTVSQSLIILEKKGFIEKNNDKIDKRIVHIHILPPGLTILNKVRQKQLFKKAVYILKESSSVSVNNGHFIAVFKSLQKASSSQSFSIGKRKSFSIMKKSTVYELIEYMAILIRSEERKKCAELKLQLVHFQVLDYLSLCNKYSDTPAAIANYLGITRGTVSQTLIILEKRDYIKKIQDNNDKRVFHIQLLNKGLDTLKKAKPTELFKKATQILKIESSVSGQEEIFVKALTALQKANNSNSFGICNTCKNFCKKSDGFFCQLTQEKLSKYDSKKICQEHIPV